MKNNLNNINKNKSKNDNKAKNTISVKEIDIISNNLVHKFKNIKKREMDYLYRYWIILICSILIIAFGYLVFYSGKGESDLKADTSNIVEVKYDINYQHIGGVNYSVLNVENSIYDDKKLGENMTYISNYIESINVNFNNIISAEDNVSIKGVYDIYAELTSYNENDNEKQIIWSKAFELVPEKNFEVTGGKYEINEDINIDYNYYNNYAQEIASSSGVSLPVDLNIKIDGSLLIGDKIEEPINSQITIPLGNNYFNITKSSDIDKLANQEQDVIKKEDGGSVFGYILGIIICLAIIASINILTKGKKDSENERNIKSIFKSYGSRIVAVKNININNYKNQFNIITKEDIIKLSDELNKPILYKYSREKKDIEEFYIIDEDTIYILNIVNNSFE
ncbi:MAG: DUF5305 family protein [Clostridium sp.]|nr:DUF5305 family protein [Clostridium sp.]